MEEIAKLRSIIEQLQSRQYVTPSDLAEMAEGLLAKIPKTDLSGFALKSEIPELPDVSQFLRRDQLPAEPDLSGYSLRSELTTEVKRLMDLIRNNATTVKAANAAAAMHGKAIESLSEQGWGNDETALAGVGLLSALGPAGLWLLNRHRNKTRSAGLDRLTESDRFKEGLNDHIKPALKPVVEAVERLSDQVNAQRQGVADLDSRFRQLQTSTGKASALQSLPVPVNEEEAKSYLAHSRIDGGNEFHDAVWGRLAKDQLTDIRDSARSTEQQKRFAELFVRQVNRDFDQMLPPLAEGATQDYFSGQSP